MSENSPWLLRLARDEDVEELEPLIALSVLGLQGQHYSHAQMEAALGTVFGVDRQLIRDGTYWVVEDHGKIVGCGGWSWRKKIYGGEGHQLGQDGALNPVEDAARIRAFFVHPDWARRGIGRCLLEACEAAILEAGFCRAEMVATLAGEPLYAACGYRVLSREEAPMPGGWVDASRGEDGEDVGCVVIQAASYSVEKKLICEHLCSSGRSSVLEKFKKHR